MTFSEVQLRPLMWRSVIKRRMRKDISTFQYMCLQDSKKMKHCKGEPKIYFGFSGVVYFQHCLTGDLRLTETRV